MKKFLLSIAAVLAIAFSANAKDVKDAPSAWGDGILDAAGIYNFNGSWQGSGTYLGDENTPYDASANDYAYIKVSSLTGGPIRFAVQYNKFVAEQSWGKEFQQEIVLMEADGIYGIKLDKNSKADGGKTFAEEIHQLVVQDNGKAGSLKIEEIGFCTEAEFKAMTTDPNAPVVGWVEKLTNVDCEADENSFFAVKENNGAIEYPKPVEGEGVNGGKCIKITSVKGAAQDWDTQFWIVAPEALPAGTKIKVSFDYKASANVSVDTQAHSNPGEYTHYEMCGAVNFKTEWQSFEKEVKISSAQAGAAGLKSIAFNLSKDKNNDVVFYIDNISLCVEEELPAQTVSFLDVQEGDITAESITVRWTPNDEITAINIDLGFMKQMSFLMEDEVKAGVHTIEMLNPDTEYTIWLSKIVEGKEVKFAEKVYKTAAKAAEISFLDVQEGDITAESITVRWTPNDEITTIAIKLDFATEMTQLMEDEVKAGVYTISTRLLKPDTEYTIWLSRLEDGKEIKFAEKVYKTLAETTGISNIIAVDSEESYNLYGQKSNGNGFSVKGGKIYLKK